MPSNVASEGKSGHSSRWPTSDSSVPAPGEIPFHCLLPTSSPRRHAERSKESLFPNVSPFASNFARDGGSLSRQTKPRLQGT
jgi:hypothetical protein